MAYFNNILSAMPSMPGAPSQPNSTIINNLPSPTTDPGLFSYHDPGVSTNGLFQSGITAAAPSNGVSAQYQQILDSIQKQQDYANGVSSASASDLAARRGLSGSSIEQFGVQQGLAQNSQAAQGAIQTTLGENAQQQTALQQLQAQLYGQRAQSLAGLNSDELTSLRNNDFQTRQLALQKSLGQQGLDIAQQNAAAQAAQAKQNATNSLITSGAQLIAPHLFNSTVGGGGAGNYGGLTQAFSGMTPGGGASAIPYTGGGTPGSTFFPGMGGVGTNAPGMFGQGGTLFNTAGTSSIGAGNVLPGIAGWQLGTGTFGDNRYTNTGGIIGATAGSMFGPLGSAAGGFIGAGLGGLSNQVANQVSSHLGNTAGSFVRYTNPLTSIPDVVNKISSGVSNVFPF